MISSFAMAFASTSRPRGLLGLENSMGNMGLCHAQGFSFIFIFGQLASSFYNCSLCVCYLFELRFTKWRERPSLGTIEAKLLTATDRDGKTPIALAKKNKQMAVEVLLRNAMKQYVTNPSSSRNSSKFLNGQWRTELSTSSINVSFHIMDVTGLLKFFIVGSSSCWCMRGCIKFSITCIQHCFLVSQGSMFQGQRHLYAIFYGISPSSSISLSMAKRINNILKSIFFLCISYS